MATTRNNEHIRYRYGICLNESCERSKTKEVQEIPARKEFVCSECGKPLRECPPPKKGSNKMMLGIIAVVVAALAIGGAFFALSGDDETAKEETVVAEKQEVAATSVVAEENSPAPAASEPKAEPAPTKPSTPTPSASASSGSKDLGYAVFKGKMKNGKPDDVNGRMEFKERHQIDSRDPKKRIAEPGDYVIGEFSEGHLVQGIWYGSDNNVKGSVIIGK